MLTHTGEYALRAMVYLAQHAQHGLVPGREVAQKADIPAKYLSHILGDLVRSGVLESSPGKNGGFRLARPAKDTTLHDVLQPFERAETQRCPFGNKRCSDQDPCLAHTEWKHVVETEREFLLGTSVYDVTVKPSKSKKKTRRPK